MNHQSFPKLSLTIDEINPIVLNQTVGKRKESAEEVKRFIRLEKKMDHMFYFFFSVCRNEKIGYCYKIIILNILKKKHFLKLTSFFFNY